jgi:DNA-binding Lrp family transcriptional regulator
MKTKTDVLNMDEQKVIDVLEQNAKESIDALAKKCGFSRQKVWRIIKKLEKQKMIWGYSAITDEEVKGLRHFVLLVKRNVVPLDDQIKNEVIHKKLDEYLPGDIKIENLFITHGAFSAVFTFTAPDLITAKKFQQKLSEKVGQYLDEYLLLESLFSVRKQGLKNPDIEKVVDFI